MPTLPVISQLLENALVTNDVATRLDAMLIAEGLNETCNAEMYAFLSVQAEMLISTSQFKGLLIDEKTISKNTIAAYDQDSKQITIYTKSFDTMPLSRILSHEMTHAVEDLSRNCATESRLSVFAKGLKDDFTTARVSFSKALPEEVVHAYLNHVVRASGVYSIERFACEAYAYIFEGVFFDITKKVDASRFIKSYKDILESARGRRGDTKEDMDNKIFTQKLIALATHDICDAMIQHIEKTRGVKSSVVVASSIGGGAAAAASGGGGSSAASASPEDLVEHREALHARLTEIRDTVAPVYNLAIEKIEGTSVEAEAPAAAAEAAAAAAAPATGCVPSSLRLRHEPIPQEINDTVTPSTELSRAFADKMKASFSIRRDFGDPTKVRLHGKAVSKSNSSSR